MRTRLVLAAAGILLALFGVSRLLTQVPTYSLMWLGIWLVAALVIHDGVVSPLVVTIGWFLRQHLPPRGRRYLQAALIMGAMVTVIAIPMIYRRNSQPASKAILQQNFAGNLSLLLGIIAGLTLVAYAIRVARDRSGPEARDRSGREANDRSDPERPDSTDAES